MLIVDIDMFFIDEYVLLFCARRVVIFNYNIIMLTFWLQLGTGLPAGVHRHACCSGYRALDVPATHRHFDPFNVGLHVICIMHSDMDIYIYI